MNLFHQIDDAVVILRSKGVYRQSKVYRRGVDVFAAHGSGFIRLTGSSGTSLPNVSWLELEGPGIHFDRPMKMPGWKEADNAAS